MKRGVRRAVEDMLVEGAASGGLGALVGAVVGALFGMDAGGVEGAFIMGVALAVVFGTVGLILGGLSGAVAGRAAEQPVTTPPPPDDAAYPIRTHCRNCGGDLQEAVIHERIPLAYCTRCTAGPCPECGSPLFAAYERGGSTPRLYCAVCRELFCTDCKVMLEEVNPDGDIPYDVWWWYCPSCESMGR